MEGKIRLLLDEIKHPESGVGLHDGGFVDSIAASAEKIVVTLRFERLKDPFSMKLKRRVEELLKERYTTIHTMVLVKEGVAPRKVDPAKVAEANSTTAGVAHIVAVASGKGGVGKSTVTANLALALSRKGFRVGVLDADIYGPSQPRMFGIEGSAPEAVVEDSGREVIKPIISEHGVKVMSIGFFIKDSDPLLWRGTMASNALKQLLHQTQWGTLDFLLIDLPPGTGDIHLTILDSAKFSAAVIVSTPQGVALADVKRGVEMFKHDKVQVKLAGIIENMAYFTPEDAPDRRYYIFGQGGASRYAAENGLNLLGEVPIYESIVGSCEAGHKVIDERVASTYDQISDDMLKGIL